MANTLNAKEALALKILVQMEANTVFMSNSWRDYEVDMVRWPSDTKAEVDIRLPNNFSVNNTWDITAVTREVQERIITLTADRVSNVSFDLTTFEDTFEIDKNFNMRTVQPASANIALDIDNYLSQQLFLGTYYHVGTAGTLVASYDAVSSVTAFMNDAAMPDDNMRLGVLSEETYGSIASFTGLQNSNAVDITKDITRKWRIGEVANVMLFHNHAIVKHTAGVGDANATPANGIVDAGDSKAAVASGTTMVIENLKASETGVFLQGDLLTIPNRQFLHPRTGVATGRPFQITITDVSVDSTAGGEATINFLPAIVTTGPYQNIDAQIAIGDNLNLATANTGVGSTVKVPYTANMFYHKSALLFAAPKIKKLFNDDAFAMNDGISIRLSGNGDILTSVRTARLDNLHGTVIDGTRSVALLG